MYLYRVEVHSSNFLVYEQSCSVNRLTIQCLLDKLEASAPFKKMYGLSEVY